MRPPPFFERASIWRHEATRWGRIIYSYFVYNISRQKCIQFPPPPSLGTSLGVIFCQKLSRNTSTMSSTCSNRALKSPRGDLTYDKKILTSCDFVPGFMSTFLRVIGRASFFTEKEIEVFHLKIVIRFVSIRLHAKETRWKGRTICSYLVFIRKANSSVSKFPPPPQL